MRAGANETSPGGVFYCGPPAPRQPFRALRLQGETQMKELIEAIAKALVDNPDRVAVRAVEGEQVTILELRVHPSDLGKVIGRQGRTARSIRAICVAARMTITQHFTLG